MQGETALFLACREGYINIVHHLLDCFANATLLDNLDRSPLQIACEKQQMEIVNLFQQSSQGPLCAPPHPPYIQKTQVAPIHMSNPMYHPADIKMEGAGPLIKPALASHHVPHPAMPPHHRIQTQQISSGHSMMAASNFDVLPPTTSSIPRVSSLEAELDKLIASTVGSDTMYPNYLPSYSSPPLSHDSPPYMTPEYSTTQAMDSSAMNHIGGNLVQDGGASSHSSPGLGTDPSMSAGTMVATSVGVSPQDLTVFSYAPTACSTDAPYPMTTNQLTAYSCQACSTSTTSTTDQVCPHQQQPLGVMGGQHPLQHLPTYTGDATSLQQGEVVFSHAPTSGTQYLGPVSSSTPPATSSVAYSQHHTQNGTKPAYSSALQNISMHGRPSPPLAQSVSGFSPQQQGAANNSPSSYGYLSPPKEPGEYQQQLYGSSYLNNDALSCLTPSPEDYSNQGNERSPPGQTTTVHTLGHYEQYQFQHYDFGAQSHISHITAPQLVSYNSRESTV